jgi:hypothetical protein
MLEALSRYKLLFEILIIGVIAVGAAWGIHEFLEHERDIGRAEVQVRWDKQIEADKEARRVREAELTRQRDDAVAQRDEREKTIRNLAAGSSAASLGLRDTLNAISSSVPTASIEALRQSTTALSSVLNECQGRYRELAEKADRHANDAKTLDDAWPK